MNVKNVIIALAMIALVGSGGYFAYNAYTLQGQVDTLATSLVTAQIAVAAVPTGLNIDINVTEDEIFSFTGVTTDGNFVELTDTLTLEITNEGTTEAIGLLLMSEDLPDDLDGLDEFDMYVTNVKKAYLVTDGDLTNGFDLPNLDVDEAWVGTITMHLDAETSEDTLSDDHDYKWDLEVYLGTTLVEDKEIIMRT